MCCVYDFAPVHRFHGIAVPFNTKQFIVLDACIIHHFLVSFHCPSYQMFIAYHKKYTAHLVWFVREMLCLKLCSRLLLWSAATMWEVNTGVYICLGVSNCIYCVFVIPKEKYSFFVTPINTLKPSQNGCHFAGYNSKCIFLNENLRISKKISLKCVPYGLIGNMAALV